MQKKLIGFLLKSGKKHAALSIFNDVCNKISVNLPIVSISYFFSLFFLKLNTNIETKKVSFRKRVHFIPVPIKKHRKVFLILKWIKQALLQNSSKIAFNKKLYNELINAVFLEQSSNLIKFKLDNEVKAYQYKSKAHYRWS